MNRKLRRKREKLKRKSEGREKTGARPPVFQDAAKYLEAGRPTEAEEAFRRHLDAYPGDAPAHCGHGAALVGQGRLNDAVGCYEKAAAIEPGYAEAHYKLGVLLQQQDNLEDAFVAEIAALDLFVTVSNTTAHLAGALGVPAWVLLNTVPLSYQMMEREDSPWYPSVRLFRQRERGAQSKVVDEVLAALRQPLEN